MVENGLYLLQASMEGSLAVAYTSGPVIGAGLHHVSNFWRVATTHVKNWLSE